MAIVLLWLLWCSNYLQLAPTGPLILACSVLFIQSLSLHSCDSAVYDYLSLVVFQFIQGLFVYLACKDFVRAAL